MPTVLPGSFHVFFLHPHSTYIVQNWWPLLECKHFLREAWGMTFQTWEYFAQLCVLVLDSRLLHKLCFNCVKMSHEAKSKVKKDKSGAAKKEAPKESGGNQFSGGFCNVILLGAMPWNCDTCVIRFEHQLDSPTLHHSCAQAWQEYTHFWDSVLKTLQK